MDRPFWIIITKFGYAVGYFTDRELCLIGSIIRLAEQHFSMLCSWFSRLDCFGGAERASSSYPLTSPSRDDVVIMWGKQRLGTKMARLDKQQVLGLGLEVIFRRTEGQGSDGLHSLSPSATNLFPIHFNLRPRLAFIANGVERRGDQTKQQTALGGASSLRVLRPSSPRSCPLDSFIKRHHSDALRGREALSHNCTRWSN